VEIKKLLYIKIGLAFLAVGLTGLVLPFISFGVSEDYVILQTIAQERREEGAVSIQDRSVIQSEAVEYPISLSVKPDLNLSDIEDRLVISVAKIDMPIFESDSVNTLLKGGWIFPGTARPGQIGNSVIFGHRFRYLPPITNTFYSLDKVELGDVFVVSWQGRVFRYQVTEKNIIEPTDFSVLNQTDESRITLITCAPLFSTKQRLVIVGILVNE